MINAAAAGRASGAAPSPGHPRGSRRPVGILGTGLLTVALSGTLVGAALPASASPADRAAVRAVATAAPAGSGVLAADGPVGGAGTVSFGIRTANAKNVDNRGVFRYDDQVPGRAFVDHLGVVNLSQQPVTLDVYPADGYNNADGALDVLPPGKASTDLGSWIKLARSRVTVPARSTVLMPFSVTVPKNAQPGDHTAGIVASYISSSRDSKGNAVKVDSRTGQRVYVRVRGDLKPGVVVEGLTADYRQGNPVGAGSTDVRFTIHNTGNVRVSAAPDVRVDGLFTNTGVDGLRELPDLLPGSSVTVTGTAKGLFPLDRDAVKVQVNSKSAVSEADPKLTPVSAAVGFWAVSWVVALAVLALLLAGGAYARRLTRRRRGGEGFADVDELEGFPDDDPDTDPDDGPDDGPDDDPDARRDGGDEDGDQDGPDGVGASATGSPAAAPAQGPARSAVLTERRATGARRSRVARLALGGLLVTAALLGGGAGVAHAADDGALTFLPAAGGPTTQFYVTTSAPCPTPAAAFVGYVEGGDFPAASVAVSLNVSGAIRYDEPFGTPLSNTLQLLAQNNGVQLKPGDYTIKLQCTDIDTVTVYRTFTGRIRLDGQLKANGPAPTEPPASGVPLTILAQSFPEVRAALQAQGPGGTPGAGTGSAVAGGVPGAAGQPGAGGAAPGGSAAGAPAPGVSGGAAAGVPPAGPGAVLGGPAEGSEGQDIHTAPASSSNGSGTGPVVLVGVVVIAGLGALRWWSGRREAAPATPPETIVWADEVDGSGGEGPAGEPAVTVPGRGDA